ncbi:anaerobic ribonucleoside-triphosphate reductase [Pseudoalteromonas prydzensis]|uniref:anaerobic ribonucleoside-triphosphate reductase n=1 Tax=Pseudoalteromonas prydzensis TaxID=182141 RepID=UPI0024BD452D|nr:anaerobic ribonucleoside-triphosphate reductase [Pseudoalteromonas prydzensis]
MLKLTPLQLQQKVSFIHNYLNAANAADGSIFDSNANVSSKNIATLEAEISKDMLIQINRQVMTDKITSLFGQQLAHEYQRQINEHEIYVHDETSLKPYCASITLYPFLLDGLTQLGGESKAPKHLSSFCGSFVNLVFAVSAQFAGAIATVEFLTYFDHFARRDYGDNYLTEYPKEITNHLQHVVYALNQPAAARGYQSVFWNISLYDQPYFSALFGDFVFPDGTRPAYNSINALQSYFMDWFGAEREKAVLTFPIVTAALLTQNQQFQDPQFKQFCAAQLSKGNSFFMYVSDDPDSLASCCRLRNEMSDNQFSYTLGAGGISTGSINVITLNMNRLEQDSRDLAQEIEKIQRYQVAYRALMQDYLDSHILSVYDAGFINMDKQFLTIGINGMAEAAEFRGITVGNNTVYKKFVSERLHTIYSLNKKAKKQYGYLFNTEFVPAENLGIKNAKWDKDDGYQVNRDCYNSYFYVVEDDNINHLDKFILHGKEIIQYLDGGSALHLNLSESLDAQQYEKLLNVAANTGCNYFCINVKCTICNDCEHIDKVTRLQCEQCHSDNIDHGTRVIGYLKRVSAFSKGRRDEHQRRYYHVD